MTPEELDQIRAIVHATQSEIRDSFDAIDDSLNRIDKKLELLDSKFRQIQEAMPRRPA